ncbi:MAG: hypothetical protein HUU01_19145 [Saprospiraceae bacterium]|nr:hypothetical protein [Saprospiraceae bacterium]
MLRRFFINLSNSETARRFVTHFGPARRLARRFVAGETLDEAVAVVKDLNARGIKGILNEVGESVTSQAEASQAAQAFQQLLERIAAEKLDSTISLKPGSFPSLRCGAQHPFLFMPMWLVGPHLCFLVWQWGYLPDGCPPAGWRKRARRQPCGVN